MIDSISYTDGVDIVLVSSLDRLSRRYQSLMEIIKRLNELGLKVISIADCDQPTLHLTKDGIEGMGEEPKASDPEDGGDQGINS